MPFCQAFPGGAFKQYPDLQMLRTKSWSSLRGSSLSAQGSLQTCVAHGRCFRREIVQKVTVNSHLQCEVQALAPNIKHLLCLMSYCISIKSFSRNRTLATDVGNSYSSDVAKAWNWLFFHSEFALPKLGILRYCYLIKAKSEGFTQTLS